MLRFKTEGVAALAELEKASSELEGEIERRFSYETYEPRTIAFLFQGPFYRLQAKRNLDLEGNPRWAQRGQVYEMVRAQNSHYSFALSRKTSSSPYLLRHYGKPVAVPKIDDRAFFTNGVHAAWRFQGKAVRAWLTTASFHVDKVTPTSVGGRTFVEVEASYTPSNPELGTMKPGESPSFTATLLMDPESYWSIRKTTHRLYEPKSGKLVAYALVDRQVEYGQPMGGYPTPSVIHEKMTFLDSALDGAGRTEEVTITVTKLVRRKAAEREFTLTAFGLPELETSFAQEKSFLWAYLIGMGGVVGVAAMILFWKFRNVSPGSPGAVTR